MSGFADFSFSTDIEIAEALGRRLKQARLDKGLQQAELAARAGIARVTLQKLENQGAATLATLIQVVRVLGMEGELQPLFVQAEPQSIADMEAREQRRRQRAPNRPKQSA